MYDDGIFAINPIKISNLSFLGNLGSGSTNMYFNLSKLVTQNILFTAYQKAQSITEISKFLGVSKNIIKDEVEYLEDNGFMDKVSKDKYITNILLNDLPQDVLEERHKIFTKYANIVCKKYIPHLINQIFPSTKSLPQNIYTPQNDRNFLMWSLITLACCKKFDIPEVNENLANHYIKKTDGSELIIYGTVDKGNEMNYQEEKYRLFGPLNFHFRFDEKSAISIKKMDSYYDDRNDDWSKFLLPEFITFCEYINDKSNNAAEKEEKVNKLINKRILIPKEKNKATQNIDKQGDFISDFFETKTEYLNMIATSMTLTELLDYFPPYPDDFKQINIDLSNEIINLCSSFYPPHIHNLFIDFTKRSISSSDIVARVLERLVSKGILKPLTNDQKKTVNMILFYNKF